VVHAGSRELPELGVVLVIFPTNASANSDRGTSKRYAKGSARVRALIFQASARGASRLIEAGYSADAGRGAEVRS
jgi:hypothetical protein